MFLGLIVVGVVAGVAAFLLTRGGSASTPGKGSAIARTTPVPRRPGAAARTRADELAAANPPAAIDGVDLSDVSPSVKKWKEPGLPGTFREIVSADDSENVEEKLTYRTRRLRFQLTDAAAACYDGDDGKQQIALSYTLVVDKAELSVIDVKLLESNLDDRNLENCIVNAVKTLRAPAPDVPDMHKDQETVISLHDLWARNRSVD